jgi:enamine deaminase RidA (YjgF/YER057c/UK114 family)
MATPETRLSELGLDLPSPAAPLAAYAPTAQLGTTVYVSGQLPLRDGSLLHVGTVGDAVSEADATDCARQCALGVLAHLRGLTGSLDRVRIVRVGVFVASHPSFTSHHKVANGASELFGDVFGTGTPHARAAVGVAALPLGAPVEVDAVAEILPS